MVINIIIIISRLHPPCQWRATHYMIVTCRFHVFVALTSAHHVACAHCAILRVRRVLCSVLLVKFACVSLLWGQLFAVELVLLVYVLASFKWTGDLWCYCQWRSGDVLASHMLDNVIWCYVIFCIFIAMCCNLTRLHLTAPSWCHCDPTWRNVA